MLRFALALSVVALSSSLVANDIPEVDSVERQPLLSQTTRLAEALESIGSPLSDESLATLQQLKSIENDRDVTRAIQQLFDPLCMATVELAGDSPQVQTSASPPDLIQQGWRACLIKVINPDGRTGRLRIESPNARSVPHSPADAVASRWLDLDSYEGQLLRSRLSGLPLEYRIVQLYSRDVGERSARFEFSGSVDAAEDPSLVKEWNFDENSEGWEAQNQSRLSTNDGVLEIASTGDDPYIATQVDAPPGNYILRFWVVSSEPTAGQVFWMTQDRPIPLGDRQKSFTVRPSKGGSLVEVPFKSNGELTGIRLDPMNRPGSLRIDWIELAAARTDAKAWSSTDITFEVIPSTPVTFEVTDGDLPAMAAFEIRDSFGRVYPLQSKRLAPDFFFHPQIYRSTGETIRLPQGTYTVRCSRGPESIPETKSLVVEDQPVTLKYDVKRWIDAAALGYWSGDHHIHAAGCQHYENPTQGVLPADMLRHCMGEDLKVGCCLTWGPCFDFQKQFFSGQVDNVSKYPYLLRYDIEVSGFGSHNSGHLNLLRLTKQIYPGGESKLHWPTLGLSTLTWAKSQGAVCGPAHSALGLTHTVGRLENTDELDGPHRLPNYNIPAFDGIGANEFVVDITHEVPGLDGKPVPAVDFISTMNTDRVAEWNMWYHALNTGFRIKASGETDFPCITGERVGIGRVYAQVDGKLEFDRWVDSIAAGRSYVSDGSCHLMDFTLEPVDDQSAAVALGDNNSELTLDEPQGVTARVRAAAYREGQPSLTVALIVNGYVADEQEIVADGKINDLTFETTLDRSSWIAVRVFPHAHTNPIFAIVDAKPIRPSRESAEWLLRGVEQCWSQKARTYRDEELTTAEKAYDHARTIYQQRIKESLPTLRPNQNN